MVMNDNLGIILAGLARAVSSGEKTSPLPIVATDGTSEFVKIYSANNVTKFTRLATQTNQTQVGKGLTPATRQDIDIENEFPSSPEKDKTRIWIYFSTWKNYDSMCNFSNY